MCILGHSSENCCTKKNNLPSRIRNGITNSISVHRGADCRICDPLPDAKSEEVVAHAGKSWMETQPIGLLSIHRGLLICDPHYVISITDAIPLSLYQAPIEK